MSQQDRLNYAWRLVRKGKFSKKQIREAASISDGQVGIMRRAQKKLGKEVNEYATWWQALSAYKGWEPDNWSDDERDAWQKAEATKLAERLSKAWGPRAVEQDMLAAMALEIYFGRRVHALIESLRMLAGPYEEEDPFIVGTSF
jgi:hypothetical protein